MTTKDADLRAKTDAEREEFGDVGDMKEIEFEVPDEIGARIGVTFTSDELDHLFIAARLAGEDEIRFIKQAALARIDTLLAERRDAVAARRP